MEKDTIKIIQTQSLTPIQKQDTLEIWNQEYPSHLYYENVEAFEAYLNKLVNPVHLIVEDDNMCTKAWLITFTRNNARWFVMMADSSLQGKGIGSVLLNKIKETESELNGWVIDHDWDMKADGTPYPSPIGFYLKNGFEVLYGTRLEKGKLSTVKIRWTK